MARWGGDVKPSKTAYNNEQAVAIKQKEVSSTATVYADSPTDLNFITLQNNLETCLSIVENEVMKNYVSSLQRCPVVPLKDENLKELQQIQFFKITQLVYQEDEFSVHKLATVFSTLSNQPCTLVLMIQSDGKTNNFYLGVRPRVSDKSSGRIRDMLEQSFLGLFPGSDTADYYTENLNSDLIRLNVGSISSVTCIADYKHNSETMENRQYIQGLEKFIYSMQGKPFTAVCIANNLTHEDLLTVKMEYERIYTMLSPFANMQYNYAMTKSESTSLSDTDGTTKTNTASVASGVNTNENFSVAEMQSQNTSHTVTETEGESSSASFGQSTTVGTSDGTNESESVTKTTGKYIGTGKSSGISVAGVSMGTNINAGTSSSVARGKTQGTSHTESFSDTVSKNLTVGLTSSKSIGKTAGETKGSSTTKSIGHGTQYNESHGESLSASLSHTKALTDTFGNSQAVTLNIQNKTLQSTLVRIEKQLCRLDECESIGMWDFAAYFLGESEAEAETAASMYRSLVCGGQSGLEASAINTWTDKSVEPIKKYVLNYLHPVFLYQRADTDFPETTLVDATALASTNELAIQLGLPRKSVKGLPVIEHAYFAQEQLSSYEESEKHSSINVGVINHLGKDTETEVKLDINSLAMHTFITGSTGSGKSNTVYHLLHSLLRRGKRFLVVEPAKGEYKNVFDSKYKINVYGTNPLITPLLKINPFSFPRKLHIYEHLDRLIEIFNVCWPMYAAMPAVLKSAVEKSYVDCGWDLIRSKNAYDDELYPTFADVARNIKTIIDSSEYDSENKGAYKGSLLTRLQSLSNGINGMIFTTDEIPMSKLFDENVIVDLSRVGSSETKSLIMGMLVLKLQEYRMTQGEMNADLKHITVLEEAHNLLKRTSTTQSAESGNLQGKSVEMIANAIAEMRTYGEGFIIADQAPGLLDMAAIRNTNTKIILRLPDQSDRELVGRAANLNESQIAELAKLPCGVAAVYQNEWVQPVLCKVNRYEVSDNAYSYTEIGEDIVTRDAAALTAIAEKLSNGIKLDKETVLTEMLPILQKNCIASSVQIAIAQHLENPPREPRMTKLAPIMSALFPTIKDAVAVAYAGNLEPMDWTRSAESALYDCVQSEISIQTRRDIIQAIITDYVYIERGNKNDLQRWAKDGGLIS